MNYELAYAVNAYFMGFFFMFFGISSMRTHFLIGGIKRGKKKLNMRNVNSIEDIKFLKRIRKLEDKRSLSLVLTFLSLMFFPIMGAFSVSIFQLGIKEVNIYQGTIPTYFYVYGWILYAILVAMFGVIWKLIYHKLQTIDTNNIKNSSLQNKLEFFKDLILNIIFTLLFVALAFEDVITEAGRVIL